MLPSTSPATSPNLLGGQHDIDLSGVPVSYLEAYPFSAFVLVLPIARRRPKLVSRDTDVTVRHYDESPLSPGSGPWPGSASATATATPGAGPSTLPSWSVGVAWGNEKWLQMTRGRPLGDCVDPLVLHRLQAWLETEDAEDVFVLEMRRPAGTVWSLTKAITPLLPPSSTHSLCIVTSQPAPTGRSFSSTFPSVSDSSDTIGSQIHRASTDTRASYSTDHRTSVSTDLTSSEPSPPVDSQSQGSYFPPTRRSDDSSTRRKSKSRASRRSPQPSNLRHASIASSAEQCWRWVDETDWSLTALGPRSEWKEYMNPILAVTFSSMSEDAAWLGDDLNILYNKPYSALVGSTINGDARKSFGLPAREIWSTVWTYIEPMVNDCLNGIPTYRENDPVFWRRYGNGIVLEHYHTWRYVPITAKDGKVVGIFNQSLETTDTVLAERRLSTVRELSEQLLLARTTREYFDAIVDCFEQNLKDAPFALCYSVTEKDRADSSINVDLHLEASSGVPENHPSAPQSMSLSVGVKPRSSFGPNAERMSSPTLSAISALSSGSGRRVHTSYDSAWPIRKALATRQCVIMDDCRELIRDYPVRVWDELPISAIVVPICSESSMDTPEAVLILGINIRRPIDAEYDSWLQVIRAHLTSAHASVKAAQAEAQRIEDAAKMDRAKTAWFKGAAHDLRGPLTLIGGPIGELLDDPRLTPGQYQSLSTAKRNVDRLTRVINALLDFSRVEAGNMEAKFVPLDLGAFVVELTDLFRGAVERLGVDFVVDVQPYDKLVFVDPTLFEMALSNLIGNSLKYTDQGRITLHVRFDEKNVLVTVADTGVGIPSAEISMATQWFHRSSTILHTGSQGTGLGLALAQELVRLHDGDLSITSETEGDAHGSSYTIRIPLLVRKTTIEPLEKMPVIGRYGQATVNEALRWGSADLEEMSSEENSSGNNRDAFVFEKTDVVLVVDDNRDMREYLHRMFSPFCKVKLALNGIEALASIAKTMPNLIITDVNMPKMGGLELIQKLRESDSTKYIPVIVLSAMTDDTTRVDALMMGAEDFMPKPFKPKELLARAGLHMQVGKKRVKLEQAFAEREMEMNVVGTYCPSGIIRTDDAGHITFVNAAWRRAAGMDDDHDPNDWGQYCSEETTNRVWGEWKAFMESGAKDLRISWKWANGTSVSGIFIRLDMVMPSLRGFLGCLADVTHEEERVIEAENRRREAEESKHQQELLIDLTSHEIRTPVSAILQCSSLVKENLQALAEQLRASGTLGFKPTPELLDDIAEDIEALESIYQCGLVQERIAGDVLSLTRIQLGMLSLHHIEMDLRKEAKKVLSVFASEARTKKIDLLLEFGETLAQTQVSGIKTDPVRLGQVVTNLIANAMRFTATSDTRRITVRYDVSFLPPAEHDCALPSPIGAPKELPAPEDTPIWLFVSVRDTGPGLGPKELQMLFKRFSQGNQMIHTRYGGSGLGLFICRQITELLGGRIEVKSQLGEGSVFRFFIQTKTIQPLSALAAYVDATTSAPPGSRAATAGSPSIPASLNITRSMTPSSSVTSPMMSPVPSSVSIAQEERGEPLHILIVEDNIINQTVLKRQIVKSGSTCDVANNGQEALDFIYAVENQLRRGESGPRKPYNVVLMDLEMPVMDGLTCIKEIRVAEREGRLRRHMVVALTGNARQGQIDQAKEAGMDEVIIKPYVLKDLLKKLQQYNGAKQSPERSPVRSAHNAQSPSTQM